MAAAADESSWRSLATTMGGVATLASFGVTILAGTGLGQGLGGQWLSWTGSRKAGVPVVTDLNAHLGTARLRLVGLELELAQQVVAPHDIQVLPDDVYGQDELKAQLKAKVLSPMRNADSLGSTLLLPPKGVLLYGPPGTGKTMLVKAMVRASGCRFLNLTPSSILSKMHGDSSKSVRAAFSLAAKLQPCIIFIDEVDALLGRRGSSGEQETGLQVKSEFMALWDGLDSDARPRVIVVGATNRREALDEAVLRRFTQQYPVRLPDDGARRAILRGYLARHARECGPGSVAPELLMEAAAAELAGRTEGRSGSDLRALCSAAAQRVRDEGAAAAGAGSASWGNDDAYDAPRPAAPATSGAPSLRLGLCGWAMALWRSLLRAAGADRPVPTAAAAAPSPTAAPAPHRPLQLDDFRAVLAAGS